MPAYELNSSLYTLWFQFQTLRPQYGFGYSRGCRPAPGTFPVDHPGPGPCEGLLHATAGWLPPHALHTWEWRQWGKVQLFLLNRRQTWPERGADPLIPVCPVGLEDMATMALSTALTLACIFGSRSPCSAQSLVV